MSSQNHSQDGYGVWADSFDVMARKTVLKLLLSKYAPKSIQMQQAITFDQAVVKNDLTTTETIEEAEVEYIDNEQLTAKDKLAEIAEKNLE